MSIDISRVAVTYAKYMKNKTAAIDDVLESFDRGYQLKGSDFPSDVVPSASRVIYFRRRERERVIFTDRNDFGCAELWDFDRLTCHKALSKSWRAVFPARRLYIYDRNFTARRLYTVSRFIHIIIRTSEVFGRKK